MVTECFTAIGMLGVVVIGLLIMTRAISVEQVAEEIWRAFILLVIALVTLCLVRGVLLPILISALVWLEQMMLWIAIVGIAVVALMLLLRMLISKLGKWLPTGGKHGKGDL